MSDVMAQDALERCAQLSSFYIEHRRARQARVRIRHEHELRRHAPEPGYIALIGESRSGKSTIKDVVVTELNVDRRRAVEFTLTEKIEPRGVLQLYLQALGDISAKGTVPELMLKAQQATPVEGVEIVFIDEAQHLRRDDARVSFARANVVKTLLDSARVPFVLIGTPELDGLIGGNNQLQNRMVDRIEITPFGRTHEDWPEFRALLRNYESRLPFGERCHLDRKPLAPALHVASGGYVGRLVRLVKAAGRSAILAGANRIETEHWARAWEVLDAPYSADRTNPFQGLELPPPEPKGPAEVDRAT